MKWKYNRYKKFDKISYEIVFKIDNNSKKLVIEMIYKQNNKK